MSEPEPKRNTPPAREWILTPDMDSVRNALTGMMAKRRMTHTKLGVEMGSTTSSMFSSFLRRVQAHLRLDSLLRAAEAMEFEVVIREPSTNKTQRRLAALKAQKEARRQAAADEVALNTDAGPEIKAEWAKMAAGDPELGLHLPDEAPNLRAAVEKMLRTR